MLPQHIRGDIYLISKAASVSKVRRSCSDLGRVRQFKSFRIRPENCAVKTQLQNISNQGSSKVQSSAICVYIPRVKLVKLCRESLSEWVYSAHTDPVSAGGYLLVMKGTWLQSNVFDLWDLSVCFTALWHRYIYSLTSQRPNQFCRRSFRITNVGVKPSGQIMGFWSHVSRYLHFEQCNMDKISNIYTSCYKIREWILRCQEL